MNILLYYVIILIREYKFIFTRYEDTPAPPSRSSFPPELTANVQGPLRLCTFAAFWVKNC